jgi:hypothetical protein
VAANGGARHGWSWPGKQQATAAASPGRELGIDRERRVRARAKAKSRACVVLVLVQPSVCVRVEFICVFWV